MCLAWKSSEYVYVPFSLFLSPIKGFEGSISNGHLYKDEEDTV